MALKATIYKATLQLADMDRNLYGDYDLTIARHPSETDERLLIRLLAFALNVPATEDEGTLEFARDMWDADEPALWRKNLVGDIQEWIEVGQPDERRLLQSCSRSRHVTAYSFSSSTPQWRNSLGPKVTGARNIALWQIPAKQSQSLAVLADRSMKIDVTVQDGAIWMGNGTKSLEISPCPPVKQRKLSSPSIDKRAVLELVIAQIEKDLAALINAAKATHAEATDQQNKAENKYDTRALEAGYLAQGQSRQVAELLKAKQEFEALNTTPTPPTAPIDVGTLLTLRRGNTDIVYLLGPKAGGLEISYGDTLITVITPQSPLGRQLIGKVQGDAITFPNHPTGDQLQIQQVW